MRVGRRNPVPPRSRVLQCLTAAARVITVECCSHTRWVISSVMVMPSADLMYIIALGRPGRAELGIGQFAQVASLLSTSGHVMVPVLVAAVAPPVPPVPSVSVVGMGPGQPVSAEAASPPRARTIAVTCLGERVVGCMGDAL